MIAMNYALFYSLHCKTNDLGFAQRGLKSERILKK